MQRRQVWVEKRHAYRWRAENLEVRAEGTCMVEGLIGHASGGKGWRDVAWVHANG